VCRPRTGLAVDNSVLLAKGDARRRPKLNKFVGLCNSWNHLYWEFAVMARYEVLGSTKVSVLENLGISKKLTAVETSAG
jgi:hypothetical protein